MSFEIEVKRGLLGATNFYIDEQVLRFGNKEIPLRTITGFGYLTTQTKVNGINTSKQFTINIYENGNTKPTVITFFASFGGGKMNDKYGLIIDKLWDYFGNRLLNDVHDKLLNAGIIELNKDVKLIAKGMVTRKKPWFKPAYEIFTPWNEIRLDGYNGNIIVKSTSNKKVYKMLASQANNSWVFYNYVTWLRANPAVIERLNTVHQHYRLIEKT